MFFQLIGYKPQTIRQITRKSVIIYLPCQQARVAGRGFSTTGVTGRLNTGGRGGGGRPAEYLLIRTHDFESRAAALGHCILWHCSPWCDCRSMPNIHVVVAIGGRKDAFSVFGPGPRCYPVSIIVSTPTVVRPGIRFAVTSTGQRRRCEVYIFNSVVVPLDCSRTTVSTQSQESLLTPYFAVTVKTVCQRTSTWP